MFKSILKGAGVGVGLWIVNKLAGTKNHETENQKGRDNQDWGYNMGAGNTTGAVRELTAKLEEFESRRGQSSNFFAQMFSDDSNISTTDKQKINLIRSFPIPNTKEDIFEFIILAASNVQETAYETNKKGSADRKLSDAWLAKLEQAYHKAKFTFGNSSDFYSIHNIYERTNEKVNNAIKKDKMQIVLIITFFVVLVAMGMLASAASWLTEHIFVLIGLIVVVAACVITALVLRHKRLMRQHDIDILKTDVSKMSEDEAGRLAKKYQEE